MFVVAQVSAAKRAHEEKIMTGGYRRVVMAPSRMLWDGGTGWCKCQNCPWGMEWQTEERMPETCPRCGSWLVGSP